jgi:hypothetical protein
MAMSQRLYDAYFGLVGDIRMTIDGVERRAVYWDDWAITTRIDGAQHWQTVSKAIQCHQSQLPTLGDLPNMTEEDNIRVFGECTFYRAFSMVNGGRDLETDLFEGLR